MDEIAKIAKHIRTIANPNQHLFSSGKTIVATVTEVTGLTCSVEWNGSEFEDVRLSVLMEGVEAYLIKPKIGTKVLVVSLDGTLENLYVQKVQEPEYIKVQIDTTTMKVSQEGILLQRGTETLQKLLLDVISMVKNIKVATPQGPSTNLISPTPPEILTLENRVKELLQ